MNASVFPQQRSTVGSGDGVQLGTGRYFPNSVFDNRQTKFKKQSTCNHESMTLTGRHCCFWRENLRLNVYMHCLSLS